MGNSDKAVNWLRVAVALLVLVNLVSIIIILQSKGKTLNKQHNPNYLSTMEAVENIAEFDGKVISGTEAKRYAFRICTELPIYFATKSVPTGFYGVESVNDYSSNHYVSNDDELLCTVTDGYVSFVQIGVTEPDWVVPPTLETTLRLSNEIGAKQYALQSELKSLSDAELSYIIAYEEFYNRYSADVIVESASTTEWKLKELLGTISKKIKFQGSLEEESVRNALISKITELEGEVHNLEATITDLENQIANRG